MLVTIDPGLATGWSLWDCGGLIACGLDSPLADPRHGAAVAAGRLSGVWIESQVIYPRSKARPADIVKLAQDAGRWAGIYSTLGVEAHFVAPSTWKGQVPKAIHHARVWAALSVPEQRIVDASCRGVAPSKRHNVLDAVGIGQWVHKTHRSAS